MRTDAQIKFLYYPLKCLCRLNLSFKRDRSSRPEVFCEKGVLRNFAKLTGKHLCQSLHLAASGEINYRGKHLAASGEINYRGDSYKLITEK